MDQGKIVLALARPIESSFTASNWTEVGYLTGTHEYVDNHPRLQRSLRFGDEDYKGNVLETVKHIIVSSDENLRILLEYEPIKSWFDENDPATYGALCMFAQGMKVADVMPAGSSTAQKALADAQVLLRERGPSSAVDRIHTGLHAFLSDICKKSGLSFPDDANTNQLLKSLLDQHPRLQDLGHRGDEMRRLIRTCGSMIEAIGTLRNRASLAHPNADLLDRADAEFVINLTRSLLHFLDAKFRE